MSGARDPLEADSDNPGGNNPGGSGGSGDPGDVVVTDQPIPAALDTASLAWSYGFGQQGAGYTMASDLLVVDDNAYLVAESVGDDFVTSMGGKLIMLDGAGKVVKEVELPLSMEYKCNPVYANGMVYVPLTQGRVCAFDAKTLEQKWLNGPVMLDEIQSFQQLYSNMLVDGGNLYVGSMGALDEAYMSQEGVIICLDAKTGDLKWAYENTYGGYYWSGFQVKGNNLYAAGDDGMLLQIDTTNGKLVSSLNLGSAVRGGIILDGDIVYLADAAGDLRVVKLDASGKPKSQEVVDFAETCSSTPILVDGKVVVGGGTADYAGIVAVIDPATLTVVETVSAPAPVQCKPLSISDDKAGDYVYFTSNNMPGALYYYQLGSGAAQAGELFVPA